MSTTPEHLNEQLLDRAVGDTTRSIIDAVMELEWMDDGDELYHLSLEIEARKQRIKSHGLAYEMDERYQDGVRLIIAGWRRFWTDEEFPERGPVPDSLIDLRTILAPSICHSEWYPDELLEEFGYK